jgi:hypothetical protein
MIADTLGTDGAAERQREEHREQRLAYRELLTFRRKRREQSRARGLHSRGHQAPPDEGKR